MLLRTLLVALATLAPAAALADNDDDFATEQVPRVVPYNGVLELDGTAFNGLADLRFSLYVSPEAEAALVWSETWSAADERAVQINGGRFAVNLGSFEPITDVIFDAGQLYLGIEVKPVDAEAYVALAGRQRINPVPYALWSAQGAQFDVAGDLAVGRDATAGRDVEAGRHITAGQNLRAVAAVRLQVDNGGWGAALKRNDAGNLIVGDINEGFAQVNVPSRLQVGGANNRREMEVFHTAIFRNAVQLNGAAIQYYNAAAGAYFQAIGFGDDGRIFLGRFGVGETVANHNMRVHNRLTVQGNVNLEDCRLCMQFKTHNNNNNNNSACVRLVSDNDSGWRRLNIPNVGDNDEFRLKFSCDGGDNYTGTSL